jgi:Prominin
MNVWSNAILFAASGQIVKDKLADVSKAVALNNLTAIATGLTKIKGDLSDISTITRELQQKSLQLNAGLVEIKQKLTQRFKECQAPCREVLVKYNIHGLSASTDFSRVSIDPCC